MPMPGSQHTPTHTLRSNVRFMAKHQRQEVAHFPRTSDGRLKAPHEGNIAGDLTIADAASSITERAIEATASDPGGMNRVLLLE